MFAGKKSAQIREILISESAWEEMTCLFAPSLMLSEPGTKWTANKVARYLYISVSTLHRRLASEGVSFQSILDDVRLNNALSAIQTTVKPISEIARENGYKCPSRFTERFHNRFKITPRELRKASRE